MYQQVMVSAIGSKAAVGGYPSPPTRGWSFSSPNPLIFVKPAAVRSVLAILVLAIALSILLISCSGPHYLSFPFDPSGRSLNSPYAELSPKAVSQYLVFVSDRAGSQDVYAYDLIKQQLLDLPELNSLDMTVAHPDISEDGRYIVFAGNRQGESNIYLYDRQLYQLRSLTKDLKAEVRNPSISADSSKIAFESNAQGQWDILIYTRAGDPLDIPMNPR
jgi:Tol biopolymer transport system component